MAHQDYSEICPIFNEGVEKEIIAQIPLSATVSTSGPVWLMQWGREVTITEIFAQAYNSTMYGSSSTSCSIGLYADQSLSVVFGSIVLASASLGATVAGEVDASMTSSLAFTSTDYLAICIESAAVFRPANALKGTVIIRYMDS